MASVTSSPTLGSATLYYHADHLGGANVLTDSTGLKKELIEYEPFGLESRHEKYGSSEEVAWYYFTGKKTDDESGLIYFGARYYDPALGRFITADTIVPYPNNPQTFNRYSYAGNNPVSYLEDGHGFWKKLWSGIKNAFGSFVGGATGATIGAFIGSMILPGLGTVIGAYIGASIGAGIGQSIQHGGNWGSNIGNSFVTTAETFAVAGAGFSMGGPVGAVSAVVGYNMAKTAIQGGSLEDVAISGLVTSAYAVAGAAYYKAIGSKVVQKGVEIHNARKAGARTPIGAETNTKNKSLDVNQGERASEQQTQNQNLSFEYEKTQVTRYVGEGEAAIIGGEKYIPNVDQFGSSKNVFFTFDEPLNSATEAQRAYNLPNKPTHRVTFAVEKTRIIYGGNVEGGTGTEVITRQEIRNVFEVRRLDN